MKISFSFPVPFFWTVRWLIGRCGRFFGRCGSRSAQRRARADDTMQEGALEVTQEAGPGDKLFTLHAYQLPAEWPSSDHATFGRPLTGTEAEKNCRWEKQRCEDCGMHSLVCVASCYLQAGELLHADPAPDTIHIRRNDGILTSGVAKKSSSTKRIGKRLCKR